MGIFAVFIEETEASYKSIYIRSGEESSTTSESSRSVNDVKDIPTNGETLVAEGEEPKRSWVFADGDN